MPHKSICTGEGDAYLDAYPEMRRWINECTTCHDRGWNPSLPDRLTARASGGEITIGGAHTLRRYFPRPLTLDEHGRCPVCAQLPD